MSAEPFLNQTSSLPVLYLSSCFCVCMYLHCSGLKIPQDQNVAALYDDEVCAVKNCQLFPPVVFRSSQSARLVYTATGLNAIYGHSFRKLYNDQDCMSAAFVHSSSETEPSSLSQRRIEPHLLCVICVVVAALSQ